MIEDRRSKYILARKITLNLYHIHKPAFLIMLMTVICRLKLCLSSYKTSEAVTRSCPFKKVLSQNVTKFTAKRLCQSLFLRGLTLQKASG